MGKGSSKFIVLALVLVLIAAISTEAQAQSVSRTVVITRAAKIGGQTIAPGKYSVAFDESKEGELVISKDGKEVLKASYTLQELSEPPSDSAVVFTAAADGSLSVRRIEIKGMKSALKFE